MLSACDVTPCEAMRISPAIVMSFPCFSLPYPFFRVAYYVFALRHSHNILLLTNYRSGLSTVLIGMVGVLFYIHSFIKFWALISRETKIILKQNSPNLESIFVSHFTTDPIGRNLIEEWNEVFIWSQQFFEIVFITDTNQTICLDVHPFYALTHK